MVGTMFAGFVYFCNTGLKDSIAITQIQEEHFNKTFEVMSIWSKQGMQLGDMKYRKGMKHKGSEYIKMANNKQNIYKNFYGMASSLGVTIEIKSCLRARNYEEASRVPGRSVASAGLTSSMRLFWMSLCKEVNEMLQCKSAIV